MFRLGIIGSGSGTNFQAIADAINNGGLPGVEVAVVISDIPDARILDRAKQMNIPAKYIAPGKYRTKLEPDIENQYAQTLKDYNVDLVVLAGFMRMVKHPLLSAFTGKIINIHPSLLPAFPGLASFKQAWEYGVKVTGCTVHFVDEGMDTGPIIGQRVVPILAGDDPHDVHERIQVEEHILYPACIKAIAQGRVTAAGRHVEIKTPGETVNVG